MRSRSVSESIKLNRVYKYRLYPTACQEESLRRRLELCRRLYNKALWWRQGEWERSQQGVTKKEQTHALVDLKQWAAEYKDMSSSTPEDVVDRVGKAYKAFFRRCKSGEKPGYPRAKGVGWYKSFAINRAREFKVTQPDGRYGQLSFKGFSNIRVRMHRPLPEDAAARRVIIKREANGHWHACFGWDMEAELAAETNGHVPIGLDVGLSAYITTNTGEKIAPPRNYKRLQRRLRRKQRRLSRATKGSNRRHRARREVAKVHAKIRARRRDFLHNLSRRLVDAHSLIAVEDLRIKNMVRNRHYANSISDAAWGEFANMLAYKAESASKSVVFVDPRNTSQECSGCGEIVKKDITVRVHRCDCGLVLDRDHNAAINILSRAVQAQRSLT